MADPFPELEDVSPQRQAEGLKTLRLALWGVVVLVVGMGLVAMLAPDRTPPASDQAAYGDLIGGPFSLTAPDGSRVTDQTLKGTPFAIFFGFTRCPDVCPTTLSRMAQLRKQLGKDGDKFRIVFVSVDPGYDSPEDIGRYVELFGTPILGLTGTDREIDAAVKAYRAFYQKVPTKDGDYTIDHTASVYLMDASGRLQSIIAYDESNPSALAKLKRLVG
ncbi:SCO family protein [Erythrobacter sp. T5W1-R]|uniref:SCO family protein n=1 Tax=Erythrobacter sp. T5W1-R TaxID=3101752 RepID=UPI002B002DDE|nr:SCO family protein [Erythrobacter sp. T5W1-R]MEA1619410.1 SCO family protein [Erythrobacter sp. T5W1-R]